MPYTQVPVGNQFIRNFPVPLDRDFVFNTTEARNNYLTDSATSGIAYTGMIVADLETNRAYLLNSNREWIQVGEQINDIFGSSNSGILIKTGNNTFAVGGLEEGSNISISNPSGLAGNPVINVVSDLSGLASVAITGSASDALSITGGASIGGTLAATSGDFSGGVTINGDLSVSGTTITFDAATITLVNFSATSGAFSGGLTVSGIPVSLDGHGHHWSDIDILNSSFCDDVGDCIDTEIIGATGIQLIYSSGNDTLTISLSGEALAQHLLNSTGFVARSGSETYVTRSIVGGSNIEVTNGDGLLGNPTISLSGTLTGLTSITSTDFIGNLTGTASNAEEVYTVVNNSSDEHYLTFVDSNNNTSDAETVYTGSGLRYVPSSNTLTIDGSISASGASITNNLVVGGDLTVNGTTVTANVDSMIIEDPIIVLGKPSGAIGAEDKDRGIEFVYPSGNGTVATTGFFGFDKSATEFIAARDVTINNEIVTVNNDSYLDAKFKDIDGSVITASSRFDGPGSGLTGIASGLTVGLASSLVGGSPGAVVYQSDTNETLFLTTGTAGQFLIVDSEGEAIQWHTLSYGDIADTPTIGDATLTFSVSGSGLSIGTDTAFTANSTTAKTFSVTSNATPANSGNTIVSRNSSGDFSAGTITATLNGSATNALNIEVDTSSSNVNHIVFVSGTDGNLKPNVNSNLRFDAANNILIGDDNTTPTTQIQYFIIDGGTP